MNKCLYENISVLDVSVDNEDSTEQNKETATFQ